MTTYHDVHRSRQHGMLWRLAERLRPSRGRIAGGLLLIIAAQFLRMFLPIITRAVVNEVIPTRNFALLVKLCAALLGLTAVRSALMYFRSMTFERVSQDLIYDLRTSLYRRMQAQSYTFYDQNRIGEIMSRMTSDMEGVRSLIMNLCMSAMENLLMFVGALCFMWYFSAKLTLLMLVICPVLAVVAWQFNRYIRPAHAAVREQNAVLNTRTQENIAGVRVVKAFAREDYEKECFSQDNLKVLELNMRATRIWSNFHPLMDFIGSLATPLLLLLGGAMVATGELDLGTLVALTGYVFMLVNPMRMLSSFVNVITQGIVSAEKLFYYLDLGSIVRDPEKVQKPEKQEGHVRFEHVTFGYGDHVVLRDISFDAKPGQTIALMGATGSGKTSIINLIGRFYDVRSGCVWVDGVDVRKQSLADLRRSVGYVMQENFLFSDAIAENIAFGNPTLSPQQVHQAADIAQASEFITHMPQAWDTVVGERGLGLSGGQKQRVSIARAVACNPHVLVLDDATSAVDMETEAAIQQGLQSVMKGRTTFVIAHRISSVIGADQILVLDHGEIAERGTHADLIARGGLYYQMFMDQYRDFADLGA